MRLAGALAWLAFVPTLAFAGEATVQVEAPPGAPAYDDLAPPDTGGLSPECANGLWRVEGAGAGADTYQTMWTPTLEHVAACLKEPKLKYACVSLRGQVTEGSLAPAAVAAFGSPGAARSMKARSRAEIVAGKLDDLGVPSSRVVQMPVSPRSDYDGVSIGLVQNCVPEPSSGIPVHPFFELGAAGTLLRADALSTTSPAVFAGAGVAVGRVFARTAVGYAAANQSEQNASIDLTAALGYRVLDIVEPAVVASLRYGSTVANQAWLARTWSAGFEAAHCQGNLLTFADVCARAAVLPWGRELKRGTQFPDGLFRTPSQGFDSVRYDLGIFLRRAL